MKSIPLFQKQNWLTAIARVLALVLVISLALPSFAAAAVPGPEGEWQLVDSPITLELFDGQDNGKMYCNYYFGGYLTPRDVPPSRCGEPFPIKFTFQASTKIFCKENPLEFEYLESLEKAEAYEICDDILTIQSFPEPLQYYRVN